MNWRVVGAVDGYTYCRGRTVNTCDCKCLSYALTNIQIVVSAVSGVSPGTSGIDAQGACSTNRCAWCECIVRIINVGTGQSTAGSHCCVSFSESDIRTANRRCIIGTEDIDRDRRGCSVSRGYGQRIGIGLTTYKLVVCGIHGVSPYTVGR